MKSEDFVYIRLHKKYNILFIAIFDSKFSQQYAESFKIFERIERFVYRLKLSQHWRIHSMLSVTQLKSSSSSRIDFFDRPKSNHSSSIFVEEDTDKVKFYTLKKMIDKRFTARRELEYLIKWKEYNSEEDVWRNLLEIRTAMNLVKEYKKMVKTIIYLFERLDSSIAIVPRVFKFTKSIISSFKASITSFGMILHKPRVIIPVSSTTPPRLSLSFSSKTWSTEPPSLSLQKAFASSSSSLKSSAPLRRFSRLFSRPSRLLLSPLWWWIGWVDGMLTGTSAFFLLGKQMLWLSAEAFRKHRRYCCLRD